MISLSILLPALLAGSVFAAGAPWTIKKIRQARNEPSAPQVNAQADTYVEALRDAFQMGDRRFLQSAMASPDPAVRQAARFVADELSSGGRGIPAYKPKGF